MTLKQKRFLKLLPRNNFNISKTMKKAGYTNATSKSGPQYYSLRRLTKKYDIRPEEVKKEIISLYNDIRETQDFTNANRNLELQSKIANIIKPDIALQHTIIFTEDEISELKCLRKSIVDAT